MELDGLIDQYTPATSVQELVINLLLTALICGILGRLYAHFGTAASNRWSFARNFALMGVTTALVVTVIKSSLALSLGLVGALSIIRFRGAIKEPEELAFIFMCVAFGVGFGANQPIVTGIGAITLFLIIYINHRRRREVLMEQSVLVNVISTNPQKAGARHFADTLGKHCPEVSMRRIDEAADRIETAFSVSGAGFDSVLSAKEDLLALDNSVEVTVLDNEGVFHG
jgi:hypothetical protein